MPAFTVRIFKAWGSPTNKPWVNTYDFGVPGTDPLTGDTLDPAVAASLINALVTAEKAIHLEQVKFVRGVVSTFVPDSIPYNPAGFVSLPLSQIGSKSSSGGVETNDLDLRLVCGVNKVTVTGRPGRAFYRGVLTEGDVLDAGGRMAFQGGDIGPAFSTYQSDMATLLTPSTSGGLQMVIISGHPTFTTVPQTVRRGGALITVDKISRTYRAPFTQRAVAAVVLGSPTVVSIDHRYFDKAA